MHIILRPVLNDRGVALLLAVTMISLLVAVTVQFSKDMRQELISSANLKESTRLGVMVKSGYNFGVAVLQQDGTENDFDSFHDGWGAVAAEDLSHLYNGGRLEVTISDLSGRLQVNSLAEQAGQDILKALLRSEDFGELSEEETDLIIAAIVDWIDEDDAESGAQETETSYYRYREPSYSARNGPMEFIEELLLIRGITPEIFHGTQESHGLKDLLTVHGDDGRININTAPLPILKALNPLIDDEMAERLIHFRQDIDNKDMLQNADWYGNILPGDITFDPAAITTSSSFFHVLSSAEHNGMEKFLDVFVHRQNGGDIAMISKKVE